mmetsp:Transcript_7470/g.14693  ORF Transcript_7470/g.14693 Transcript_7470/m.14693 type:complete len:138 (-) Transcript_7470:532-945(-)
MVYLPTNQTTKYPQLKEKYTTTNQHFHDNPHKLEPNKLSTFGKLYENSVYFMSKRLEEKPRDAREDNVKLGVEPPPLTFSGKISDLSYRGNGEFGMTNNLTYSVKPVRLVPYQSLTFKSEYGDKYTAKNVPGSSKRK